MEKDVVRIHNGVLLALRKESSRRLHQHGWGWITASEGRQAEEDRYHAVSLRGPEGKGGKMNRKQSGRETNHERLWSPGNKLRVSGGRKGERG